MQKALQIMSPSLQNIAFGVYLIHILLPFHYINIIMSERWEGKTEGEKQH